MGVLRIYFAGPLFTPYERSFIDECAAALRTDGTACEIGMFHALMQSDPSKKGIVGLLTDMRGMRGESTGVNLLVQGAIEDVGRIVASIDEARDVLRAWR